MLVFRTIHILLAVALLGAAQVSPLTQTFEALKPTRVLALQAQTAHVQGIDTDGTHLWVTAVDRPTRKGFLQRFSLKDGALEQTIEVQNGDRYHPGGIAADEHSIWLPVAEYRANSASLIERRNKQTLALEFSFPVSDHIGCLAVTPEFIIGGNWDSRDFYVWDHQGRLIRKVASTSANAYQDLKFRDGQLIGSGTLTGALPAVDWLDPASVKLIRRLRLGTTDTGAPLTREGMTLFNDQLWLLPEDGASRLFIFSLPPALHDSR